MKPGNLSPNCSTMRWDRKQDFIHFNLGFSKTLFDLKETGDFTSENGEIMVSFNQLASQIPTDGHIWP